MHKAKVYYRSWINKSLQRKHMSQNTCRISKTLPTLKKDLELGVCAIRGKTVRRVLLRSFKRLGLLRTSMKVPPSKMKSRQAACLNNKDLLLCMLRSENPVVICNASNRPPVRSVRGIGGVWQKRYGCGPATNAGDYFWFVQRCGREARLPRPRLRV